MPNKSRLFSTMPIECVCFDGVFVFQVNVAMMQRNAHESGTETSCLAFSYDGHTLASRGGDDTLKLWDIRRLKSPLAAAADLPNLYPVTDCCFSPDDKMVLTGTSVQRGHGTGKLVFLDKTNLSTMHEMHVVEGQVSNTTHL
jgi:WD40 repeat protein